MFHWLWAHPFVFWPVMSILYVGIGTLLGLHLYWRYCRHHYEKHNWRGGNFQTYDTRGCWCYEGSFFTSTFLPITFITPLIWPAVLAGVILSIPIKAITKLYDQVENLANWDGKTIKGSIGSGQQPPRVETLDEEIARRSKEITDRLLRNSDHS